MADTLLQHEFLRRTRRDAVDQIFIHNVDPAMKKLIDRLISNSIVVCGDPLSRPLRATLVAIVALGLASCGEQTEREPHYAAAR